LLRLPSFLVAFLVSGCTIIHAPPPGSIEHGRSAAIASIARSPEIAEWLAEKPRVSILPMRSPSGHPMTVGDVVLHDIEHWLVAQHATVVSRERQHEMICEVVRQGGTPFDPRYTAKLGRQLGTRWFVTGTVTPMARYWNFRGTKQGWTDRSTIHVKIIDAETSRILWEDRLPAVEHASEHVSPSGQLNDAPSWEDALSTAAPGACPPTATRSTPAPSPAASAPAPARDVDLAPFDRATASRRLVDVTNGVYACDRADAPKRRTGIANVTFANDGKVERVDLDDTYETTATGECVRARFSSVAVAPFRGPRATLSQRFSLNRSTARNP
jgi:TolB-like protein